MKRYEQMTASEKAIFNEGANCFYNKGYNHKTYSFGSPYKAGSEEQKLFDAGKNWERQSEEG